MTLVTDPGEESEREKGERGMERVSESYCGKEIDQMREERTLRGK